MATYLLRNSLNPGKVVGCTITFRQLINKGDNGESAWVVEIRTNEPHKDGGSILPVFVHYTSADNLDEAIGQATKSIANQVDWEPLSVDYRPPFVLFHSPQNGDVVDIYSDVIIDIKDLLPAAGIDPDSIEVVINNIDVTNEVELTGDPYEYRLIWKPRDRVLDTY